MLLKLGVKRENIWLCDLTGWSTRAATEDEPAERPPLRKAATSATLDEVIDGADLFLGLSGPAS
jgi:malate dehydrogenase (oxaloacetate-decarboxylating)(NADP+)